MGYYSRLVILIVLGLIVLSPHIVSQVQEREITFADDEAYQLMGVRNMLDGNLYSVEFPNKDLAAPTLFRHMYEWPPGLTFTIFFMTKVGFSLIGAMLTFKIFFVLIGIVAWSYVGEKILRNYPLLLIFVIILPEMVIFNPTDLLCWALTPGLLLCLQNSTFQRETLDYKYLMAASSFTAIMILFKYSVVFFIPAGILFYMLDGGFRGKFFWKQAFTFSALPIVTYFAINIFNRAYTQTSSYISSMKFSPDFGFPSYLAPLKSVFMIPFELHRLIRVIVPQTGASDLYVIPFVIFFTSVMVYYWIQQRRNQAYILIWSTLALSALSVFLLLDIFSFSSIGFHSAEHYRYYSVVSPLFVVLILAASGWVIRHKTSFMPRFLVVLSMVVLLIFPFKFSIDNLVGIFRDSNKKPDLRTASLIRATKDITGTKDKSPQKHFGHIKYFSKIDEMKVLGLPRERAPLDDPYNPTYWETAFCSKPTWVFFYEYRPLKNYYYNRRIREIANHLQLQQRYTDKWIMHFKKFPRGNILR